jgi:hypothetical protein
MKTIPFEHIEAKIINFLRDTKAPSHASQIAIHILETRQDTLQGIQRLVRNSTIKGIQDFTLFSSTGETVAYTLAGAPPEPPPIAPAIPPSEMTGQLRRGPAPGR